MHVSSIFDDGRNLTPSPFGRNRNKTDLTDKIDSNYFFYLFTQNLDIKLM